jgi:hygromycin-B 4-O-kinase
MELRPDVDESDARTLLESCLGPGDMQISKMDGGELASMFRCVTDGEVAVLQLMDKTLSAGLRNERRFAEQLRANGVPIREVLCDGWHKGDQYTVYREPQGRGLDGLGRDELEAALPAVFDILLGIAAVNIEGNSGFGWLDDQGNGPHETWLAHLENVGEEEPGMFYGNWHHMFEDTFLERDRFSRYLDLMREALGTVDAQRRLVHGSFGYDRVRVENGRVVAVLNWADARYGDTLFDIAYMSYWWSDVDLVGLFEQHCANRGIQYDGYGRRVRACKYFIALDGMRYFARTGNRRAYDATIAIAETLGETT